MNWLRRHQIKFRSTPLEHRAGLVVVSCDGEYRDGCAGNPDAAAIIEYCRKLVRAEEIDGIILDYSRLAYRWGDMIEGTLDIVIGVDDGRVRSVPAVIVVGDQCEEALRTLLLDDYAALCADSIAAAVPLLERRINERTEAEHVVGGNGG